MKQKMIKPILYPPRCNDNEDFCYKNITYPGVKSGMYLISNYGDVYSIATDRIMTQQTTRDDHKRISLVSIHPDRSDYRNKKGTKFSIHRLVAHEFIDPVTNGHEDEVVDHVNGVPYYNYYKNLDYCTDPENRRRAKEMGLFVHGEDNHMTKFKEETVRNICSLLEQGKTRKEILETYGYSTKSQNRELYDLIRHLHNRTSWRHVTEEYNY